MDRYERILALHRHLKLARYPVSLAKLMDELGCSRATLYRDLAFLRDALGAPVESDSTGEGGFRYDEKEAERFELPGLWLNSDELHALLATHQLLDRTGSGVLSQALAPLKARIESLLSQQAGGKRWPMETRARDRLLRAPARRGSFRVVAERGARAQAPGFDYLARSTNERSHREVSPQRLTHYRDNWYLDAWDHDREALRSFSVDRIQHARVRDEPRATFPTPSSTSTWPRATASSPARPRARRRSCSRPRRALGRRRALALEAGRALPAGRPLPAEASLQQCQGTADGRVALRRRTRRSPSRCPCASRPRRCCSWPLPAYEK
jgi:predicted DNA-binding transcriptional regulator YafY